MMSSNKITQDLSSCSELEDIVKSLDQGSNSVIQALSYGESYPGIDIIRLIPVLDELHSTVVELARMAEKPGELF
jgi:hypothetical protein